MEDKKRRKKLAEDRTDILVLEKVKVYIPEKDVDKRVDFLFVMMLTGLSHMLMAWGDMECKGGGCIDPKEQLFHCKACVMSGLRNHVDQAIERWKERSR
jgi:hypothetical protein